MPALSAHRPGRGTKQMAPAGAEAKCLKGVVGRVGFEPTTNGLRVRCSTS